MIESRHATPGPLGKEKTPAGGARDGVPRFPHAGTARKRWRDSAVNLLWNLGRISNLSDKFRVTKRCRSNCHRCHGVKRSTSVSISPLSETELRLPCHRSVARSALRSPRAAAKLEDHLRSYSSWRLEMLARIGKNGVFTPSRVLCSLTRLAETASHEEC